MACSSQIAPYAILMRQAHNPEVAGSNPAPATKKALLSGAFCLQAGAATPILHHRDQRWETFTEEVIKLVCKERSGVFFCLWARPPSAARSTSIGDVTTSFGRASLGVGAGAHAVLRLQALLAGQRPA